MSELSNQAQSSIVKNHESPIKKKPRTIPHVFGRGGTDGAHRIKYNHLL